MPDKIEFIKVKLPVCTLSFPRLAKPEAFEGSGEEKFSATFLIEKNEDVSEIRNAIKKIMATYHSGKSYAKDIREDYKCFGDGDDKDYDGFAGRFFLKGKSKKRIPCVDIRTRTGIDTSIPDEASKLYAGCQVKAVVSLFGYNYGGKKPGIGCTIQSIGKVNEGERLDGGDAMTDYQDDYDKYEDAAAGSEIGMDDLPF